MLRIRNKKLRIRILTVKIRNFVSGSCFGSFPKSYMMKKISWVSLILGREWVKNIKLKKLTTWILYGNGRFFCVFLPKTKFLFCFPAKTAKTSLFAKFWSCHVGVQDGAGGVAVGQKNGLILPDTMLCLPAFLLFFFISHVKKYSFFSFLPSRWRWRQMPCILPTQILSRMTVETPPLSSVVKNKHLRRRLKFASLKWKVWKVLWSVTAAHHLSDIFCYRNLDCKL